MRFENKTVVITGAARGIGAAAAARFAAEGANVVIADIDLPTAEATASDVAGNSGATSNAGTGTVTAYRLDAGDPQSWRDLATRLQARGQVVDVVVNNAYVLVKAPADETEEDDWNRQIAVDLSSVYHSVRTFMGDLRQTKGCIVNVSSVHALSTLPDHPAYAAAKGGVLALTRQLAVQYGPEVRVNAVIPGPIMTHTWDGVSPEGLADAAADTALHRLGEPQEVASVIAFLASNEASYVTGAQLVVDGGQTARL